MKSKEALINQIKEAFDKLKPYYEQSNDSLIVLDTSYGKTTETMAYGPNIAEVVFNAMHIAVAMANKEDDQNLKDQLVISMIGLLKIEPTDEFFDKVKSEIAVIKEAIEKDKSKIAVVVARKQ